MINETQDATNIINQMDEAKAPSMSLGGTNSVIDLNPKASKGIEGGSHDDRSINYDDKTTEAMLNGRNYNDKDIVDDVIDGVVDERENWGYQHDTGQTKEKGSNWKSDYENMDHGQLKTELENILKKQDDTQNKITELEEYLTRINNGKMSMQDYGDLAKMLNIHPKSNWMESKANNEFIQAINQTINQSKSTLTDLYNREEYITYNSNYDPRDYGQRREDTSTERKTEDYLKAGLNPAGVGGYYGSSGGGSSSSASDEEEKRKRKKAQKEALQREKEREKRETALKIINMLMGNATNLASAGIRAKGFSDSAKIRNKGLIDKAWSDVQAKYYMKN